MSEESKTAIILTFIVSLAVCFCISQMTSCDTERAKLGKPMFEKL